MNKLDYEKLGKLIMENGLEDGVGLFFSYEGEEHFAKQVELLELDLFASTECLEQVIKRLMYKYLQEWNKQDKTEEIFQSMLEVVG